MKRGNQTIFGREFNQRKAFFKGLLTGLVAHGRIRTTEARAKALKREADKLVTKAKKGTLASRRLLLRQVGTAAAAKLVSDVAPKFAARQGGYTRVVKLGRRNSDGSPMALIEFVQ
jgi:large subunit ribosomal protein L17